MTVRGPADTDRTIILGDTGSGKSVFAVALLSSRNWADDSDNPIPWFIIDYKGEDLIEKVLVACKRWIKTVSVYSDPPKTPGLYYVKVRPHIDDVAIEAFLAKIYHRASNGPKKRRLGSGIFLDEGYALPRNSKYFDILLTQGRSLGCPIICLYQRPVEMSRFAVSQSTFRAVLRLGDKRDQKTASEFIKPVKGENGEVISVFNELPKYHALWYDVGRGVSTILAPAPPEKVIIKSFIDRLRPSKERALV